MVLFKIYLNYATPPPPPPVNDTHILRLFYLTSMTSWDKSFSHKKNVSFAHHTNTSSRTSRSMASINGHKPVRTVEISKKIFFIVRIGGCLCFSIWFILYYMFTPDGKKRYEKTKTISPSLPPHSVTLPSPHLSLSSHCMLGSDNTSDG